MNEVMSGIPEFVEAVEAGGFSAAALRMNLSRSAIGKTIARLEARLGVRLFHRTTRSQSLTEEGQAFYERCRRALDEIRTGQAMLESGKQEVAGRLRISMPVLFGRRCVAPLLIEFARLHPKLELDLSFTDRVVDLLDEGFDLAIRNGPLKDSTGLMARRLFYHRMIVCAAPDYLAARGTPHSVSDLAGHDTLAYVRSGELRTWLFPRENAVPLEFVPPSRLRFDDLEAIADAAAAGMGLAWLTCWLVRDRFQSGALVPVLKDLSGFTYDAHAVWPRTTHLPLKMRAVIDMLVARLPRTME